MREHKTYPAVLASIALAALLTLALIGCSSSSDNNDTVDDASDVGGEPLPAPKANIQITYANKGDSMARVTVTKFFGADTLVSRDVRVGRRASIVKFDGGVPIWEIKADRTFAGELSSITGATYAVKQIQYGTLPAHFMQVLPDEGPPEPLDRGAYYVFEVERASGSTSYQAVKVLADGSLEAYNAQPRAGSSYLLCCNIPADFPEPVVVPDESVSPDNGGTPDQQPPDNPPSDSQN